MYQVPNYLHTSLVLGHHIVIWFCVLSVESCAYLWCSWCNYLPFHPHINRNSYSSGESCALKSKFVYLIVFLPHLILTSPYYLSEIWSSQPTACSSSLIFVFQGAYYLVLPFIPVITTASIGMERKGCLSLNFPGPNIFIQLFSSEEDDTDLSDNFIVKTCQRFIPVTCNVPSLFLAVYFCHLQKFIWLDYV